MRVTYLGPHDEVELPALTHVTVRRGESIEVSDELGAQLIEQRAWDAEPDEINRWVGDDPQRAGRLLLAEQNGAQRADLAARLELIATPPAGSDPASDAASDAAGDPVAVPHGTAGEVLAWVGEDPDRANRALVAELSGRNRAGLKTQLERLSTAPVDEGE